MPASPAYKPPITRSEKRLAFNVAIKNGSSIGEACAIAGISRTSGTAWAKKIRERDGFDAAKDSILSRVASLEKLTALAVAPETEPRDAIKAIEAVSAIQGYFAPSKSQVEIRSVPASVEAWMEQLITIDATEPALIDNAPLKALPPKPSTD